MLEVGLGGSRAGTLEPNFSKSYFGLLSLLPTNVPPKSFSWCFRPLQFGDRATLLFQVQPHVCWSDHHLANVVTWRPLGSFMWSRMKSCYMWWSQKCILKVDLCRFYSTFPNQVQSIFCGREARLKSVSLP